MDINLINSPADQRVSGRVAAVSLPSGKSSRSWIVYRATSPSGKVYVGVTSLGLTRRKKLHFVHARSPSSRTRHTHMGRALLKYGDAFTWEILRDGIRSQQEAWSIERRLINEFQSNDPAFGYNGTQGGEGCPPVAKSEEHKERLRESNAHPLLRSDGIAFLTGGEASKALGFQSGDAVLKAIRAGRPAGGFTFEKISVGRYRELVAEGCGWNGAVVDVPKGTSGKKLSPEHRAKLRAAKRGREHSESHRSNRLRAISKPVFRSDGARFSSIQEAAEATGLSRHQIYHAIRRLRVVDGLVYDHEPVTPEHVARAFELHERKILPRTILRSDGEVFPNMTEAARSVKRAVSTVSQAITAGRPVGGFTFTKKVTQGLAESPQGEKNCG